MSSCILQPPQKLRWMGNSSEEHGNFILPIFDYRRVMMIEQWIWGGQLHIIYYTFWTHQITGALKIIELRSYICKAWHSIRILFWRTSSGHARSKTCESQVLYPACPLEVRQKRMRMLCQALQMWQVRPQPSHREARTPLNRDPILWFIPYHRFTHIYIYTHTCRIYKPYMIWM